VIGMARDAILERFLTQLPTRFEVAPGPVQLNAVVIGVDDAGRATGIERVSALSE
jgi:calcineurin-like phosphoesterase